MVKPWWKPPFCTGHVEPRACGVEGLGYRAAYGVRGTWWKTQPDFWERFVVSNVYCDDRKYGHRWTYDHIGVYIEPFACSRCSQCSQCSHFHWWIIGNRTCTKINNKWGKNARHNLVKIANNFRWKCLVVISRDEVWWNQPWFGGLPNSRLRSHWILAVDDTWWNRVSISYTGVT